jgi:hypothetical protein
MPRRPGITFETVTPSPPDTLPRMDIAAFVGFATRGPIDVPVPAEDVARFRDVFGPPLELVQDRETGRTKTAHLHRAVEAFFRNGGRRCWVVRVAQPKEAGASSGPVERTSFGLPGLVSADTGRPSTVRARCYGASFDALRVGTVLRRRVLSNPSAVEWPEGNASSQASTLSWHTGRRDPLMEDELAEGDLLRLSMENGGVAYAIVASQTRIERNGDSTTSGLSLKVQLDSAYLFERDPTLLTDPFAGDGTETEERDVLWRVSPEDDFSGARSSAIVTVERLRFDLLAWKGQELQTRLDHLGFAPSHPRAWTDLPVDEDLFELQEGETVTPELGILRADVFEPRFPLASPASPEPGPFIPLGMADRPDPSRTRGRIPQTVERSRLEKERLSTFSTDVFVDGTFDKDGTGDDLAGTSTATLGEKADDMIYVDQNPASGLHSLWPIREVTLLAVPDAIHRGWNEPETITPGSLPAPSPLKMSVHTDPPRIHLSWMVDRLGEEGVEVAVQEAQEPTFDNPMIRYRGTETSVDRYVRSDDPVTLFFRYRVVTAGQPGPWSDTRYATLPEPDFDSCTARPGVPSVARVGDRWFTWGLLPEPAESALTYELQIDRTPAFDAPSDVSPAVLPPADTPPDVETIGGYEPTEMANLDAIGGGDPIDLDPRSWYKVPLSPDTPAVRYVRLRARLETDDRTLVGGWSRTVPFVRDLEQRKSCITAQEYDDPETDTPGGGRAGLIDVQRAMLRFGAARGDVLSVLALPEQDQPDDAHRHVNRLRSPGAVLNYDEERTLSYGALYYPWLLGPVDDGERITPMPPDGAACGMIADRTLRDGAWMAPANQSLATVRTVVPPLSSDERAELGASPLNVFTETPDGVLTLGTATLARDPDLEPITTRRLLILVRRLAQREGPALVFENNTPLLRRRIAEQFDDVLRRLFDRGAFAGATPSDGYRVVTDESVNPPGQVERGRLVVELRIAPARPLTFLTVRLVQRSGQQPAVREPGTAVAA